VLFGRIEQFETSQAPRSQSVVDAMSRSSRVDRGQFDGRGKR
jgi:hypothetical protein